MIRHHWHVACRATRLAGKRPVAVTMFGTPLVLFRDRAGQAACLTDRCPHRNMPLSQGRVCAGVVECPYHGWRFDGAGKLADLPSLANRGDWPAHVAAQSWPVIEQDGLIWVALADQPPLAPPPRLPMAGEAGWHSFLMVTDFDGTVADCLENFLDCPHAAHVHKSWFRSPTGKVVEAVIRTESTGAVAEYINEPTEKSLIWQTFGRISGQAENSDQPPLIHTDRFIAPATSQVDYIFNDGRHYIITSHCTPVDEGKTRVFTHITLRAPLGALVRLVFAPLSRLIIRQDVAAMRKQQANIARFGERRFTYAKSDLLMRHIIAWRRALDTGETPPPEGEERHVALRL